MMTVYLIQACLFVLGVIPFLCEISKHFKDSYFTIVMRLLVFIATLIGGYYAPMLENYHESVSIIIALGLFYFSVTQLKQITLAYFSKLEKGLKHGFK